MTRPRIGLALGSGSARGWSHIGIINSLIEAGIEPDIVCGTSIGALVGAAYVAGRLDRTAAVGGGGHLAGDCRADGCPAFGRRADRRQTGGRIPARARDRGADRELCQALCGRRHRSRSPAARSGCSPARSTRRCARRSRCPGYSARPGSTTNGWWTAASPIRSRSRSAVRSGRT